MLRPTNTIPVIRTADRPWENECPHMNAAIPECRPATEEYLRADRARHLPRRRKRVLCPAGESTRAAGGNNRRRVAACRGMAERGGLVGQGQGTRAAIQGGDHEDGAADHRRGDQAVPRQRILEPRVRLWRRGNYFGRNGRQKLNRQALTCRFGGTWNRFGPANRLFVQLPLMNGFLTSFSR